MTENYDPISPTVSFHPNHHPELFRPSISAFDHDGRRLHSLQLHYGFTVYLSLDQVRDLAALLIRHVQTQRIPADEPTVSGPEVQAEVIPA